MSTFAHMETDPLVRAAREQSRKLQFRENVVRAAELGHIPESRFARDDLTEAFRPEEIEDLRARAIEVHQENQATAEKRQRRLELQAMTKRVLQEQDEERRRKAETEARRRLGWDDR